MSILAVVPARGGSKGIPYKNIKLMNGKPLIYYIVNELLKVTEVNNVVVSTDDDRIEKAVKKFFRNKVDILKRPADISGDLATSESAVEHAICSIRHTYEYTMLVQCTSPLTEKNDFIRLIKYVKNYDSAAYYTCNHSFYFDLDEDYYKLRSPRRVRQVKPFRKQEVGNAWIFKTDGFMKYKSRLFGRVNTCEIKYPKNLEIDTIEDFRVIECIMRLREE